MLPWLKPAPGYMKPLLRVAFLLGVLMLVKQPEVKDNGSSG